MIPFVHLHVHSEFSLLDGLAHLPALCDRAKDYGMTSLALTDHGQMYGMIKFQRAAKHAGIKPIFGCEVYQAPRRLYQKEAGLDNHAYHLVLLAQNTAGYHNLLKLVTKANLDGFYYRPRIDRELLAEHADGLICLSACLSGQVPSLISENRQQEARETIGWFKELFGRDRYFLELQRHAGVPELEAVNAQLTELAQEYNLRCAVTNDVHYVNRADAASHELLLAIQTDTVMSDPKRMRMGSDDYYLMSPEEMAARFQEYPEALENTAYIADQCNATIIASGYHLPQYKVPEPYTPESYLRMLCEQGIARRYGESTPAIRTRLDYELEVIHKMGFDDYFLVTWDVVNWAKHTAKMLVGPGRGSGAASIVSYLLGITELEPLSLDLVFERFLNPDRNTMPDIDLDYPEDRRGEVIEYLTKRYGEERTAQIATFDTMAARAAIRECGRALEINQNVIDMVAKLMPGDPKKKIEDGIEESIDLKAVYESQPEVKQLIDAAIPLQGLARHLSTHAAGVLITDRPLVEYAPMQRTPRTEGILSQFCMEDVEASGLLKLDILGLSTLTMIERAFRWIEQTHGISLTLEMLPMDDADTFALLCSGEVTGVFQVESAGMRRTLRDMQPTEFKDISAAIALYRPGPMQYIATYINRKFGRESVEYRHPKLEPILAETYGIIVYQEQIIRLVSDLAGFTPAEADLMRRAIGKKKQKDIDEQKGKFIRGAVERGISEETAQAIFGDIEAFANYGFNKAHSAAYAVITLQTAYLKAHYPAEYLAAILSVESDNLDKIGIMINECRRIGIPVRPPDINHSGVDFVLEAADESCTAAGTQSLLNAASLAIRYGLAAIKNCGSGPAEAIVNARGDQPFKDLDDFLHRVDLRQVNKRGLECLVRAGALDCLGERGALLAGIDMMLAECQRIQREKECGQRSFFDLSDISLGSDAATINLPVTYQELPKKEQFNDEKALLGTYLSGHPLDALLRNRDSRLTPINTLDESSVGQKVMLAGIIKESHLHITKSGEKMVFANMEDHSGSIDLTIFPRTLEVVKDILEESSALLLVSGKADFRSDKPQVIVDNLEVYQPQNATPVPAKGELQARGIDVEIPLNGDEPSSIAVVERVYNLLTNSQGNTPFHLSLSTPSGRVMVEFAQASTQYSRTLEQEVVRLVGRDHFRVDWD
ncbi:MAG: DNA polymerase III subunit alpha [Chloroflexi bacterium]|nr:DNA polymerase III subunit alpha [Chloroflexota bacterium]